MPYHVEGEELSPQEFEDDPRWSRAIRARNRIYPALKQAPASDTSALSGSPAGPGKPAALPQGKSAPPKLKKHPPLPRLPATDFKIVFRPRVGLDLRPINGGALLPILCAGAEIDYNQASSKGKLRINPHNNSLTVSMPSEPRMKRYVQRQGLQLNDQQYPMKAYVAAPDNAIKGILYNAVYNQSQEEIFEDLVALNPSRTFTIADARQLGRTKSILVTFINATEVPRQLNFYGAPGHRVDVCPKERTGLCPRCGIAHPIKPTPDCTPKCILCGGAHFTGTRRCKQHHCQIHHPDNTTSESTPCVSTREFQKLKKSPPIPFKVQKPFENKLPTRPPSKPFGQKDQNIEKEVSWRPQLSSLEKENAELRAQLTHQRREISELKQQLQALLRRDHSPVMLPRVVQPRIRPDVPGSSSASPSRATSPTRSPPAKRKSNTENELAPQPVAEQLALMTTSLQTLELQNSSCFEPNANRWASRSSSGRGTRTSAITSKLALGFSASNPLPGLLELHMPECFAIYTCHVFAAVRVPRVSGVRTPQVPGRCLSYLQPVLYHVLFVHSGHRRSATATVDMLQSLGLELRHRDAARARAADIVDQWFARRGAATRRPSAPAASVADIPVPSGEVPNDLPMTTPAPAALQPTDTFEPVTVELPVTSDEEVMDKSTSRKRGRDSEDEEKVFKQSKGLGALPDSKRKPLTPPSGSAAGERAPDAATAATGAVGPAASTPTAEKTASTAVPGKPATTPTGVTASLETAEPRQLEPHRKVPQHTAADFLKRNRRPATNVATKKQKKKKTARAKHPPPAGAPLAGSSSLQDASPSTPTSPPQQADPRQPTPEAMTSRARAHEPAGSTPEVTDDFSLVMSRAARRRTRGHVHRGTLPGGRPRSFRGRSFLASDPSVAGTVLFRPSEKGGSFAKESRLALASALSSLQGGRRFPVHCSVHTDDIALWTSGPRRSFPAIRTCLQEALDASVGHLASVGLTVLSAKTKALLVHPRSATRRSTACLSEGPGARHLVNRRRAHRPELDHGPDGHRSWFLPFTSKPFAMVRMTASVWGLRVRGGTKHHPLDTQVVSEAVDPGVGFGAALAAAAPSSWSKYPAPPPPNCYGYG
ncbi:hypothetical protein HPB49_009729 [Dermacentor silvarum]|uniref:Uncharacterized protein n=1 Tax=Dermacentor silvarum TaxID=543639 RepID=A0ACB8CQY7_DERSI|nr:hypothetical protein HPB49_009729 [Dermacentor silvarum]